MNQSATMQARGTPMLVGYKVDQPDFLTNNWKMLQANSEYYGSSSNRFVKVKGGVISITNGSIVVRCPVGLPDGFYVISEDNEFVGGDPRQDYPWYSFPDCDAIMPNFKTLDYTPPLPKKAQGEVDILTIVEYCNFVRKSSTGSRSRVAIEGDTLIAIDVRESWLTLPFIIPVNTGSLVFEAYDLKLVFTEMLRYDAVHIGFDNYLPNNKTLVVGRDWGHCALLTGK